MNSKQSKTVVSVLGFILHTYPKTDGLRRSHSITTHTIHTLLLFSYRTVQGPPVTSEASIVLFGDAHSVSPGRPPNNTLTRKAVQNARSRRRRFVGGWHSLAGNSLAKFKCWCTRAAARARTTVAFVANALSEIDKGEATRQHPSHE